MFLKTPTIIERGAKGDTLLSSPPTQSQLNSYSDNTFLIYHGEELVFSWLLAESFPHKTSDTMAFAKNLKQWSISGSTTD
jgi:hypothetical protein